MRTAARFKFWAGFFLPLIAILGSGGLAGVLPEDVLWLSAVRSVLLTLPRWLVLAWVPWGAWWAWKDKRWLCGAWALASLLAAGIPPWLPGDDEALLLVAANVQAYSDEVKPLEEALGKLEADVIITVEKRGAKIAGMKRVADNYERDLPRTSHGSAVFCKKGHLCRAEITEEYGRLPGCGMPIALVRVNAAMCVVGLHAPPPAPVCAAGLVPYTEEVASHIEDGRIAEDWGPCQESDPVVVMGDLNYVPASRVHRLLRERGLSDEAAIHGIWASSWPAGGGWPNFPFFRLDQVLAGEVEVSGIRFFRLPDADHRAVSARVRP